MKKILALTLALAMVVTMFTACGSSSNDTTTVAEKEVATVDASKVNFMNKGQLTVGIEVGYPPFEQFAEDGTTPEGYDVDIISEVAKRLGVKVNFVNTAFDGIFKGIDKNYDVVCSAITITKERKKTMLFSDPYIDNYQAVVVKADDNKKISSFKDLEGMQVGLQEGTTSLEIMKDLIGTKTLKKASYIQSEKVTGCFEQLKNGEVDAVLVDSTVADGQVAKDKSIKIAWKDDKEPEQFGIAMGKKNKELQKAINAALADMEKEGVIKDSYDYWFVKGN